MDDQHLATMQESTQRKTMQPEQAEAGESQASPEALENLAATAVSTPLGNMTLSMFEKGQYVRVRVGSAHNATELYEHAFESADEANTALLDAGILSKEQVTDPSKVVGTGIALDGITAEQLEHAGLKRHLSGSL